MLGHDFFEWADRLTLTASYDDVLAVLLERRLAALMGADAVAVEEVKEDGTVLRSHGAMVDGATESRLLGRCAVAGVRMVMSRAADGFSLEEIERFDVVGALVRCTLRRLCSEVYLKRMRERLFLSRRDALVAIFVVEGRNVIPFNPGSVDCAETWWGPDQLSYELPEEQAATFCQVIEQSWLNPIEADWIPVTMEIGGGVLPMLGMARHGGGALLILTRKTRPETPEGRVPMLTQRQCGIMDWIAEGKTSADVGAILEISPRTVEKHLEAVFDRFGVDNRVAAVRMYLDLKAGKDPRRSVG